MKIAIIGGGPAGFAAAITLAKQNNKVTILEKNSDVLKKLLLTGNGKCNYFNNTQNITKYHSNSNIANLVKKENLDKVINFWNDLGIIPIVKNGYFYPFSETSSSIKSALVNKAYDLGVDIKCNEEVIDVLLNGKQLLVITNSYQELYDKVIVATGSVCYPKTGSTGFGYDLAKKFNIDLVDINPSLVQLNTNLGIEKLWKGIRTHVKVKHIENDQLIKEEEGEIQLTDYGISGICIFNLSRNISIGLKNNQKETIEINFVPWVLSDLQSFLEERNVYLPNRNITQLCDAFLNYKLLYAICNKLNIDPNKNWNDLSSTDKKLFCQSLRAMKVDIVGTKGFDNAQVCSGGIALSELDEKFAAKNIDNLQFCGEVLDIDGDCGGYNLTIAILTGILAGEAR